MKEPGLRPKARRKFKVTTCQSKWPYHVAPNRLKQNFTASKPNEAWVSAGPLMYTYTMTHVGDLSKRLLNT